MFDLMTRHPNILHKGILIKTLYNRLHAVIGDCEFGKYHIMDYEGLSEIAPHLDSAFYHYIPVTYISYRLVQDCGIASAFNALEIPQSCTKPLM